MIKILTIFCAAFSYIGCAQHNATTNLTPIEVYESHVSTFIDPDVDFSKYQTFAVIPYSGIGVTGLNSIAERQMGFYLRNLLESRGYKYVTSQDSADFVITMNASNVERDHYIPARSVEVPVWMPAKTSTSKTKTQGNVSAYGSGGYAYGDYSETSTTKTTDQGHLESKTEIQGGYTEVRFHPEVNIYAYDSKTSKNIYQASGSAASYSSDVRLASEVLGERCAKDIPHCKSSIQDCQLLNGRAGLTVLIATVDGNNFWPFVTNVISGSPAWDADLFYGDMIMSVDGVEMRNKDLTFYNCALRGEPGALRVLEIWRDGSKFKTTCKLKPREEVYQSEGK